MTVQTPRTARRARKFLLGSTALVAAVAAMPAFAQSTASPQLGGTITYTGGSLTDTTNPNGGILVTDAGDVMLDGVTISTNTPTTSSIAAYEQRSAAGAGTSLTLRGINVINGQIDVSGTDAQALAVSGDGNVLVTLESGSRTSLTSELGLYLYSATGSVSLINNGLLNIDSTLNLSGASGATAGGILAKGAGVNLQLGMVDMTSSYTSVLVRPTGAGDVTVTTTGGTMVDDGSGISINTAYSGNITVDNQAAIHGTLGNSISATTSGASGSISLRTSGTGTIDNEYGLPIPSAVRASITNAANSGSISVDIGAAIGSIYNQHGYGVNATTLGSGSVQIVTSASISSFYRGIAFGAQSSGANSVQIGGDVTTGWNALYNTPGAYAGLFDVSVAAGVNVRGNTQQGGYSTVTLRGGTFDNAGTISNGAEGTPGNGTTIEQLSGSNEAFSITNRAGGTINGGTRAILFAGSGLHSATLEQGSTTIGDIVNGGTGSTSVTVAGDFQGSFVSTSGASADTLTLEATGSITGNVQLGDGDDQFVWRGGLLDGFVDGGAGTDAFVSDLGAGNSRSIVTLTDFENIEHRSGTLTFTGTLASPITVSGGTLGIAGTGAILGGDYLAINVVGTGGSIDNLGTITNTGTGGDGYGSAIGVFASGTTVINNGSTTNGSAEIAAVNSAINHIAGATGALVVNNYGLIHGYTGIENPAMSGELTINNYAGGRILGEGMSGYSAAISHGSDELLTVANAGTITGTDYGISAIGPVTLSNSGTISGLYDAGINLNGNITLTANTGTISGVPFGIYSNGTTGTNSITNDAGGTISGDNGIVLASATTVNNSGTISGAGSGGTGVHLAQTSTVTNSGSIIGGSGGTGVYLGNGGTVVNNAGASIGSGGIGINVLGAAATITNSGTISSGTGYAAVYLDKGGSLTNNSGATITGGAAGIDVRGAAGTIDNYGTINAGNAAGIMLSAGGTATNHANITATGNNSTGLRSTGAASTLDNRGTINANIGIRTDASGSTLNNSGTINATSFGIYVPSGSATVFNSGSVNGSVGATLNGGGSITNTGTLSGGSYGVTSSGAATTLVNSGTISGGSGAISLSTFNDTVTLNAGSVTTGSINLSSGNDTINIMTGATFGAIAGGNGTDTVVLGGTTTGALNLATVTTFEILNKTDTGTWTLNGTAASPAMAITAGNGTPSGTLIFNGTGLTGTIAVNGAIIRATSAGAFGTGTITAIDPTIQYGATGTYANRIILASADPVNDPTRIEADSGVVATLTGQLLEQGTGQPLVIGGAGTIVLTNQSNLWSGGTTILAGATLQGSGTAFGNGYNGIVNDGTVIFNETGTYTQYGVISGSGNLIKRGSGTRVLTSWNSYTGATTIEAGTLQLTNNLALASSSEIALTGATAILDNNSGTDGAVLNNLSGVAGSQVLLRGKSATLANSANTLFAGTLSGTSSTGITKTGAGTLTLSGNNSGLTAPLLINAGTVALVDGGSLANAGYIAVNGSTFDVSGVSGTGTSIKDLRGTGGSVLLGDKLLTITAGAYGNSFAGVISGTGGVTLASGIATFAGANTYSGATTVVENAQLNLSGAGTLANSDMTLNGFFQLLDSDSTIRSISGGSNLSSASLSGHTLTIRNGGSYAGQFNNGSLNLTGGTLVLTGNSSLNTIALNGGNLTLGDGGSNGYLYGANFALNSGTLTINKADDWAVANINGGAGNLVKSGAGLLTLWNNSFTGSTTVTNGTLRLELGNALADSAALIVESGGTAELFGADETIGSLSGAGSFNTNGNLLTLTDGGDFSGVISDAGGNGRLVIAGGTLTLTGASTYTGGTTIASDAALSLGNGGTAGSVLGLITAEGTLTADRSDSFTIQGLAGAGSFVQAGTGTTHLAGDNGFSGITVIQAGTLALDNIHALEDGNSVALAGTGATLDLSGLNNANDTVRIANLSGIAGSTVLLGGSMLTVMMDGNTSFAGSLRRGAGDLPALAVAGSGTLTLAGESALTGASVETGATLAMTGGGTLGADALMFMTGGSFDISGVAGGSYALGDLYGNGTVTLGATDLTLANARISTILGFGGTIQGTGGLRIAAGNFKLFGDQSYSGGTQVDNGATLQLIDSSLANSLVTVDGTLEIDSASNTHIANLAGSGSVLLYSELTIGEDDSDATFSGTLSGSGRLSKFGLGTWTVTSSNTLSDLLLFDGNIVLTGEGSIGADANVVIAFGTLDISGITADSLSVGDISDRGTVLLGDKTLVITNGSQVYGGSMEGTGGVRIAGGFGTFSREQLYTGSTTIDAGTTLYLVGFDGALTGAAEVNGTLDVDLHAGLPRIGGLNGTGTVYLGTNSLEITGGGSFSGNITSAAGSTGGLTFTAGTSTLSGTNDYAGATVIESGATLQLAGTSSLANSVVTADGTLDISNVTFGATVANLSGAGNVVLGARDLAVGGDGNDSQFDGVISGTGGLIKLGSGVLTLAGANSYSGLTSVQEGTLRLGAAGVLADDSTLEVLNGATLDMNGFDETVASFSIMGNLIGNGTLTAQRYTFFGGQIDQNLGGGVIYQVAGSTLLNGNSAGSAVHVEDGALVLGADDRLADNAIVTVDSWATLDLQTFSDTIGSLVLAGYLDGTGTLTAGSYTLDDGVVNANLGTGTLIQRSGDSYLNGSAAAGIVNIDGGTLLLGASDRLADNATVTVAAGAALDLRNFSDTVGALALAGTLDGTGTLSAGTYTLDSAAVNANLGTGTLIQRSGISVLNGTAATGTVNVTGGTLQLGASDRLVDTAAVSVATGTTLDLQSFSETIGTLALAGTLSGTGTLTAATYTLDSATVNANLGTGTLIQRSGISLLNGTAATAVVNVDGGTLRLGGADRLADTAAVTVASGTTLDVQAYSDTVSTLALAGTLSGSGTLSATTYTLDNAVVNANLGTGMLIQHSGTSLLSGAAAATTVNVDAGTLRLGAADRLADTAAVTIATGATLDVQAYSDTVGTLALAGTLSGTGTLTASSYLLDNAIVNANLGTGTLIQHSGISILNGTAATTTVNVDAGVLRLGAANRLADIAAVTVASGTSLDLQGYSDTIGTLALAGTLSGSGTLTAVSYTLNGATIDANLGTGTLVQASGTSTLHGTFSGDAIQLNSGTLALDRANAVTYAGTLTGTGNLAQVGSGVLTLSGNSAAFAGTTSVSAGGLAVTGQLGGNVIVSAGTLSGSGSIGGAVSIANGVHLVGANGSTLSMGSLALSSGSAIDVTLSQPSNTALFAVAGDLTLDGTLNITAQAGFGTGVYRLISYGGALTDNGLVLGTVTGATTDGLTVQTAAAGQVNLINSNGATLAFWDGATVSNKDNGIVDGGAGTWNLGTRNWTDANGTINGPMQPVPSFAVFQGIGGNVTIDNGAGQVSATGMQFATNGYTLSGGALALSGTQAIVRVGDGTASGAGITATIASALTGSSALVKTDLGTLVLTGINSYTGGTIVQAGTLVGNVASIQGNIQNAGTVNFNQATNAGFAGTISGTGSYVKSGAGALTLTGASSSNWQITAGSLISTTALFTGNADLAQGTSLVFNQATSGSYAGTLTGTGSVLFQGGGTVLLTGNSSAFAGTTSIGTGSMFSVNGTLGGTINVLAGGRLQGSGTAGSASIAGTIAPGNSIGTLTFTGNLAFTSGSVFEVEANAAGQSDKIVVNGSASIASGSTVTVLAADGNYAANTSYTILTAAGGLSGTFSNVTSNLAFLTPSLAYTTNAVTLSLKRNTIDFATVTQTGNQRAVAPAVQALGAGNSVYEATVALTAAEARAAFDQLAGSDYASLRASLVEDSRFVRDAMLARDEMAGAEGLAVWGRVIGSWRTVDGSAEAKGYKRSTQGFVTGFDGSFDSHWRMGVALSYGTSEFRTGNATHKAESYQAGTGLLGSYGPVSIQVGGAYGWHAVASQRHVAFGSLNQMLGDKYDARTFQTFGQLAVRGSIRGVDLQPFVSLAHVTLFDAGVNEHGGGAALHGGDDGFDATYGSLGLKTRIGWDLGGTKLSIDGSAAARRVFGDRVPTIALAFAGGNAFQASGIPLDKTSAAVDLGLELDLSEHIRLGISYTGTYADRSTDHGARAQLSWRF